MTNDLTPMPSTPDTVRGSFGQLPLLDRIYDARVKLMMDGGSIPNRVYLGHKEKTELRHCADTQFLHPKRKSDTSPPEMTVFGLEIFFVDRESHLLVARDPLDP